MKFLFKTFIILLVIMMMVSSFVACGNSKETIKPNDDVIYINDEYKIIWPSKEDRIVSKISAKLCSLMCENKGDFSVTNDFYRDVNDIKEKEILIGNTYREESQVGKLSNTEYVIKVVDQKIVVNAGSIIALDSACGYFYDYIVENDFTVSKDFVFNGTVENSYEKKIMIADQYNGGVGILDVSDPFGEPVRESFVKTLNSTIAGLKYRETKKYGKVILACNGSSNAEIFAYPSMKRLWYAQNTANNPHSVEITPDGKIFVVVSSTGGALMFYNTSYPASKGVKVTFRGAHGVLYDIKNEWFWVTGDNMVSAYKAEIDSKGDLKIWEMVDKRFTLPTPSAHDLMTYAGDDEKLWVTTDDCVYIMDKNTGKCVLNYDNNNKINLYAVKGISNFYDGSVTLVHPDKLYKDWTSSKVICSYLLEFSGEQYFVEHLLPDKAHIYKVRAFIPDYFY